MKLWKRSSIVLGQRKVIISKLNISNCVLKDPHILASIIYHYLHIKKKITRDNN